MRGMAALRSVEKHMSRFTVVIQENAAQMDAHHSADAGFLPEASGTSWVELIDRAAQLSQALREARGANLSSPLLARLGLAFDATQDAWRQRWGGQAATDDAVVSESTRMQWEGATLRVQAARAGLNQVLLKYNTAIAQFPARLLVKVLGFKPAALM